MENQWNKPEGVGATDPPIVYEIREPLFTDAYPMYVGGMVAYPLSHSPVKRKTRVQSNFYHANETYRGNMVCTIHHEMDIRDQWFGNHVADLIQRVCSYFYTPKGETWEPMKGVPEIVVTDDEVRERIRRIDLGENYREAAANRDGKHVRYPLQELPFNQQRALIEQIDEFKLAVGFRIIGPDPLYVPEVPAPFDLEFPDNVAWG